MSGWFLMHRRWMASADFKPEPFTEPQAFIWSIEQAAHSPHLQWFNGVQYTVDRGEFVTSLHSMMTAFGWSEKRVRGFRERMCKAQKWAKRGAHTGAKAPTILTVCNYAIYQTPALINGEAAEEAKGEQRAKEGRSEGEEQKEGQNNSNEFEAMDGEERGLAPRALALPYSEAWDAWKHIAKLRGWIKQDPKLTPARKSGLGKILKEYGLEGWIAALQRASDSALLGGPDPPAWFTTDFVTTPTKFLKLYEGNYDKSFGSHQQQQSPWLDARANLSVQ